jgi:hypothetical protein
MLYLPITAHSLSRSLETGSSKLEDEPSLPLELQHAIIKLSLPPPALHSCKERNANLKRFALVLKAWMLVAPREVLAFICLGPTFGRSFPNGLAVGKSWKTPDGLDRERVKRIVLIDSSRRPNVELLLKHAHALKHIYLNTTSSDDFNSLWRPLKASPAPLGTLQLSFAASDAEARDSGDEDVERQGDGRWRTLGP